MTDIAISNLAWLPHDDKKVFKLMSELDIRYLEISPFRKSANLSSVNSVSANLQRNILKTYNIKISSMQALLFRHSELTIFKEKSIREKTFDHLVKIIKFADMLEAKTLIFGAPKNKLRDKMKYSEALDISQDFFGRIGEKAEKYGINFCIEPTPSVYGADFIRNTTEALELINAVNSKSLKLNLDIGSLILNKEDIETVLSKNIQHIGHIHISEPYLRTINLDHSFHRKIANAIKFSFYSGIIAIEMLPQSKNNIHTIRKTLSFIKEAYE